MMKMKKLLAGFLTATMIITMAGCGTAKSPAADTQGEVNIDETSQAEETEGSAEDTQKDKYKVGFAVYNLTNPVWSELVEEAQRYGAEQGLEVTYADAGQDSEKQISQIENYIQSGVDALVILAIDVAAVEPLAKKAMEQGIYVVDYCRGLENADTVLKLDPEATGKALAQMAKEWIDQHYSEDETVKWGFLDIPTVELGVQEGAATEAEMKKILPNAELVANAGTLTVEEGLKNAESIIQANPDLRVMLGLSAGSGVGGNEAMKAASGGNYEEYAMFSIDATEQEVVAIMNSETLKGSISLGSGIHHARMLIDYTVSLLNGEEVEREYFMPITPITAENAEEFYNETYK